MIKRMYILLLAIVASVGMMNAKVTWNSSNISDLKARSYQSYSKEGVTLSANSDMVEARWQDFGDESMDGISFNANETGGYTFSNSLGKNFTKIEMTLTGPGGWDMANLGSGWSFSWDYMNDKPATVTWTGNASTVDLAKDASDFNGERVKSIVFYFVGDSEAPDPTYTVALKAGTANADKVTLSATSAVEGATITVTPNEEYEIKAFKAYYVVVEDQLGSIYDIDATLNAETGAYSFTMPAYDVTIEATIAAKPVPEGDIFAGFTATAGSGGFDNEGHANLVDNKFISSDWTKWCANDGHKSVPTGESVDACWWIDFEASAALYPTGYILTTGNDSGSEHGRNPKNWVLKAKLNAGDAWTTIATVTNDVTMKNKSFKDYKFFVDQSGSYKYFRFEVFANQGANVMQLCQLRLIGTDAPAPAGLQVTELQVPASWADNPTMLSISDMPGFVAITEAEAAAWDAAPAGNVVLIFAFEGDGATALSFKNGVYQAAQAHNITYEDLYAWSVLGRQIFYTGGGSTPDPDPTPTPSGDGDKLAGAFSVGGDKVVYFSKANLQATTADNGSTWTWGFAEHQYDFIGNAAANNAINGGGTVSTNGPVDLFAWSSTDNNYFGINNSINEADYSGNFKDWGAKMGSDWRTLTINEWQYLLQERNPGSSSANHTSYPRYTNAQILTDGTAPQKDINGIILFPDDFNDGGESIDGVTWGSINPSFFSSDPTTCTTAGWATLESMGCVFLPSAGSRQKFGDEFAIVDVAIMGNYWSSTLYSGEPEDPQSIVVGNGTLGIGTNPRYFGMSVRLVSETAPSSTPTPAGNLKLTEFQVPASWENDNSPITSADFPDDFVATTYEIASALPVPSDKPSLVVFDFPVDDEMSVYTKMGGQVSGPSTGTIYRNAIFEQSVGYDVHYFYPVHDEGGSSAPTEYNLTITQKPMETIDVGGLRVTIHSEEYADLIFFIKDISAMTLNKTYELNSDMSKFYCSVTFQDDIRELSAATLTKTENAGLVRFTGYAEDSHHDWYFTFDYQETTGGSTPTTWTSLQVGDVIKVGDQLSPSVEWESANDYGVIKPAWAPYTLLRANIAQEHEWDDPVVTEAEDGAYYVFKFTHPTSGTSYLLANSGKSPLLAATATSDGLEVTNVGDDYGTPAFTFAVHDGGGSAPAGTVTVVFEANNNQKEVEVTLPHTFACDFENGNGELDGIIQELYALQYGGYCQAFTVPTATGNAAVTASKDGNNHYIAISEAFEGTATVTGGYIKYLDTEHMGNTSVDYTLTISVQGSDPAPAPANSCGDGLTWELSEGVLTISYDGVGTGEMTDFDYEYDQDPVNVAPWKENKSEITTVIVGDGVKSIGNYAFNDLYENFTAVTIANSVERIGVSAFMNAKWVTEITLPSSLKTIDRECFAANFGFTSITIPSGVTSIGYHAFGYCTGLTSLTCEATTPPTLASGVFYKITSKTSDMSNIPLYVPSESVAAYEAAAQWNAFDVQAIPGGGSTDVIPCTAADLGKVLCTDGSIYATVSEATAAGKTAAAVIAYVDTENGKALALALADDGEMEWATAKTTAPAHTPAVSNGTWTLASKDDWNNMITAAGSYTALRDGFSAVGGTNMQQDAYWSSTPENDNAWIFYFAYGGKWVDGYVDDPSYVRACLAFDIPAAPAAPAYETVMNLINEIPNPAVLTAECKAKIDAARAAFIALSDGDKDLVTNIATLTTAEAAFDNVMDIWLSGDCDVILWSDTTLTVRKHAGEGNGAMADYTSYYGSNTAPWYNSHWYNPQPGDIVIKSVTIEEGVTRIGDNAFAWMSEMKTVTIPSSMTSIGEDAFYWSKAVDDIYLTVADPANLTWILPYSADNQFKPEKATLCHVPADLLTAYQENFGTLNMTFVGDLDPITPLTPEQQQALDAVKGLINAIPSPVVYTPACEEAIADARAAYDALTPEMLKQLVSNYNVLTAAEAAYEKAKADTEAAAPVIALINELPNPMTDADLKLSVYDKVTGARAAYDALTADQQALVSNYSILTAAEAAFDAIGGGGGPAFSVNASGDVVVFAPGNLQATLASSTWTWSFAANQWDIIGNAAANTSVNGNGTLSADGTVDLFGWVGNSSTVLTDGMAQNGISNSKTAEDYGNVTGEALKSDWSTFANANSLGGRTDWRLLTNDEWAYIINTRSATYRYCKATVNNVIGLVIFPDDYSHPSGVAAIQDANNTKSSYASNVWTAEDWALMATAGATFLPAGGYRVGANVYDVESTGRYWTSASHPQSAASAYGIDFFYLGSTNGNVRVYGLYRYYGASIRLAAPAVVSPIAQAQAAVDLINAIPNPVTLDSKDAIEAARAAVDALGENAKLIDAADMAKLTDAEQALKDLNQAEADKVIAKINNIPLPVELKLATRDSINNARAAYDALNAAQQALVSNYQTLLDAEAALAALNPGGSIPVDIVWDGNTGIANVDPNTTSPAYEGMTVTVGNGSSFSTYQSRLYFTFYSQPNGGFIFANENGTNITKVVIESTTALTSTMTEVDRMGSGWVISNGNKTATWTGNADSVSIWEGQSFTNYWVVDRITFTVNGVGATPLDSAQAVKDLIDAIPVPVTLDSKDEIDAARDAYDALADLTKGALDNATVKKLTDAEDAYAALIKEATDVIALINAIPQPVVYNEACGDSIIAARNAYDALSDELKPLVTNYPVLTDAEATYEALAPRIWTSGDCQVVFWPGDSAMIVSKLPGEGNGVMDNYANKKSVPWVDYQLKVKTLTIESGVTEIGSCAFYELRNLEGGLVIPEGVTAIHENGFRNCLKLTSITLPSTITLLGDDADAFNNCKAANISITADPNKLAWNDDFDDFIYSYSQQDVHKTTICHVPVDFYEIYVAKFDQTVNVTFVGDLPAALSPAEHAAIEAVKDSIAAIGAEISYPESGAAIDAARSAYDALDDDLMPFVSNYQTLLDAEDAYADAKQAHDAVAAAVVDKINAIPVPVEYSSKSAIDTARVAYDSLLITQKALVPDSILQKLTDAEATWAAIAAKVEHNVTYIGKDGILKQDIVALLNVPDPAPEFNGYEFVRWDVKAGNFLEEGLRIKAVYTPIITTNPAAYDSLMYNGTAQTLITAGVAKEGHIEYRINDGEWSAELPQATFAAAYVVYYKLVREGHADYIADPINVTIAKAPVTYTAPTAVESLVYTASNQTLIAAGQTQDGTFEYSLDPTLMGSWKAELPQAKDAGTYSVYYRIQGDLNHLDSVAATPVAVTIAKEELTATADDKNVIYGDAVPAYTVTYAGWQGDDDATVLTGDLAFACEYTSTSNVGEYTIVPSGATATNYTITFVNGKVTVAKAESGCIAPVVYDTLVYNGANQTLIIAGQPMGGEMQYSLDTTVLDCWSTSLPQAKDAGTYNVYYRVKGDMNHNDHYYDLITVSIAKAALTATADDKNVVYGDAVPEYSVSYSGWMGTDDATVLTGTIAFACEYAPTSNVDEYTIVPSGVDAANYIITFINGKVTVAKADLMITADDKSVIYGEVAPAFTASYSGWKNSDDASVVSGLTLTSEYLVTSNVGTYDIVPANASATNYAISYTNGTLTVNQAALTITANDTTMIYGDEHPEFTVTYAGWKNSDDESVVSGLQFSTPYAPGSYIGTYAINPNSATALNYAITFVDGTLTVNKAHVYVSDAEAQIAKFADGHANAVVLEQGILNGIKLNDPIAHVTTAAFSSADVAENLTITLFYELTGDAALLNNYNLDPTSEIFTNEGVIIEPFIPDNEEKPEDEEATVDEGIEIYAYGYCDGSGYSLKYHLESGNPDQYKIDFADSRFTDVDWTNLVITGKDGTIDIEIPVDLPTGDYSMTVYFRDSRFDWLESRQFNVTFHVNLPETYVRPLFDNVIALVDTCNCLTDIQWYWRANSTELWQPIEGANGYYYHVDGKLTGEYFVSAKMNGEPTYTCGQTDMETLYGDQTEKAQVKAYPNPVVEKTNVTIEGSEERVHSIRIVNLMGIEVMNSTFEGTTTTVEMSTYPQGHYMISVDGIVVKVMKK